MIPRQPRPRHVPLQRPRRRRRHHLRARRGRGRLRRRLALPGPRGHHRRRRRHPRLRHRARRRHRLLGPSGAITRTTLDAAPTQLALAGPSTCAATPAGASPVGAPTTSASSAAAPAAPPRPPVSCPTSPRRPARRRRPPLLRLERLHLTLLGRQRPRRARPAQRHRPRPVARRRAPHARRDPRRARPHHHLRPDHDAALLLGDNRASTLALGPTSIGTPEPPPRAPPVPPRSPRGRPRTRLRRGCRPRRLLGRRQRRPARPRPPGPAHAYADRTVRRRPAKGVAASHPTHFSAKRRGSP